jgi:hypothetical protein
MATVSDDARFSGDELLKAVEQLSLPELRKFTSDVLALQARRSGQHPPEIESVLLDRIRRTLPEDLRARQDVLIARRDARTLTDDEHRELISLSDDVERREADRLEALAVLAALRGTSLAELFGELGLASASP